MPWSSIDAVYLLCHPEKEPSRWQRLQEHLLERGVPKEKWVQMAPTWGDQLSETVFQVYDPFLPRSSPYLSWKGRALSMGELSLMLNFWSAVDHAIDSGHTIVLFFESDVFLRYDFSSRMKDLLGLLEARPWDFVSLSDGVGSHAERTDLNQTTSLYAATGVYKPPHQCPFRCADSMLFRVDFLRKMRPTAIPFRECLDWELNYQLAIHGGVPLWVEPHLVEQGSCKGRMVSTLPA